MSEQTAKPERISLLVKAAYGFGGMFCYFITTLVPGYYFLFFLTNIAGISAVLAATTYTMVNVIKTVVMAFSGVIIDSTNLKWGRYRSWILIGNIFLFAFAGAMFFNFKYSNPVVYCVIILIFYLFNQLGYNITWTADRALVGIMANNTKDAVGLTAGANVFGTLSMVIFGIVYPVVFGWFDGSSQQYMLTAYAFGLFMIPATFITMIISKPYETTAVSVDKTNKPKEDKIPITQMIKMLSGPGLIYFLSIIISNLASGFQTALLAYYTMYYLNNPAALALSVTLSSVFGFLGSFASPWICSKFTKKWAYFGSQVLCGILYLFFRFIGANAVLFLILKCAITFCSSPVGTAMVAIANDVADWNEQQGKANAKGFMQSMMGLGIRIGGLLSSAVASFALPILGYVSGTVPSVEMLDSIVSLMAFGPCIGCLGCALMMLAYHIDEKELDAYRQEKLKKA